MVDKNFNIYSYQLILALVSYQAAILNGEVDEAQKYFDKIPDTHYTKLAKFLETNEQKELAYSITPDKDHKFDLAISLNKHEEAYTIAEEQ